QRVDFFLHRALGRDVREIHGATGIDRHLDLLRRERTLRRARGTARERVLSGAATRAYDDRHRVLRSRRRSGSRTTATTAATARATAIERRERSARPVLRFLELGVG